MRNQTPGVATKIRRDVRDVEVFPEGSGDQVQHQTAPFLGNCTRRTSPIISGFENQQGFTLGEPVVYRITDFCS